MSNVKVAMERKAERCGHQRDRGENVCETMCKKEIVREGTIDEMRREIGNKKRRRSSGSYVPRIVLGWYFRVYWIT